MIQSTEKPDRVRELLDRNLQEVFGEGDDTRRRAAIAELWAEDGVLYVPPGIITGHAAIDSFAGALGGSWHLCLSSGSAPARINA